jgi:5'-3' exonuclease
LPLLATTLEQSNIKTFAMGGYEADDLIGTIARKATKRNLLVKL